MTGTWKKGREEIGIRCGILKGNLGKVGTEDLVSNGSDGILRLERLQWLW
jgi:hypothetical protein